MSKKYMCPSCSGFGRIFTRIFINKKNNMPSVSGIKCGLCNGLGKIDDIKLIWIARGKRLRDYRVNNIGVSLRKAAELLNMDYSNLSKMERGIINPKNVWLKIKN